jgi:hypothetical protein
MDRRSREESPAEGRGLPVKLRIRPVLVTATFRRPPNTAWSPPNTWVNVMTWVRLVGLV